MQSSRWIIQKSNAGSELSRTNRCSNASYAQNTRLEVRWQECDALAFPCRGAVPPREQGRLLCRYSVRNGARHEGEKIFDAIHRKNVIIIISWIVWLLKETKFYTQKFYFRETVVTEIYSSFTTTTATTTATVTSHTTRNNSLEPWATPAPLWRTSFRLALALVAARAAGASARLLNVNLEVAITSSSAGDAQLNYCPLYALVH